MQFFKRALARSLFAVSLVYVTRAHCSPQMVCARETQIVFKTWKPVFFVSSLVVFQASRAFFFFARFALYSSLYILCYVHLLSGWCIKEKAQFFVIYWSACRSPFFLFLFASQFPRVVAPIYHLRRQMLLTMWLCVCLALFLLRVVVTNAETTPAAELTAFAELSYDWNSSLDF